MFEDIDNKNKVIILVLLVLVLGCIIIYRIYNQFSYNLDCPYDDNELMLGKQYFSNSKIVICGLVRDVGIRMLTIKKRLYSMTKYFKEYKILIVENDSRDNTRKYLLDWAKQDPNVVILGCGINVDKCKLNLKKTDGHPIANWRIEKMVYLRNIYLDYIKQYLSNYDLMMVYDLDLISNITENGMYHSGYLFNEDTTIDAVCSNGKNFFSNRYYDTYAHKEFDENAEINNIFDSYENNVFSEYNKYSCYQEPRPVESCFGGCTIYRIRSVLGKYYFLEKDGNDSPLCEHRSFHKDINVIFDPRMLHNVYFNPP